MTSQDDDNTVHVSMRMKFNFFLYNKLSLFNLNILVVKDGSHLASERWSSCASMMAASLVAHMLNEPLKHVLLPKKVSHKSVHLPLLAI